MPSPIAPTIGRMVYFVGNDLRIRAAVIAAVHGPDCVSLDVSPAFTGDPEGPLRTSVVYQDGTGPLCGFSWHWMPFQLGQAQKTTDEVAELRARVAELERRALPEV